MRGRSWFRSWWLTVPEPRDISIAYTVIYSIAFVTGLAIMVSPPTTLLAEVGRAVMVALGVLMLVGAVIGMVGGALDLWQLERIGVVFMAASLALNAFVMVTMQNHHILGDSFVMLLGILLISLGTLVVRYLMIRRFTYRPRG